jgi:peroxiredoxin
MYGKTVMGVIRSTFVIDEAGKIELPSTTKATGHVASLMASWDWLRTYFSAVIAVRRGE